MGLVLGEEAELYPQQNCSSCNQCVLPDISRPSRSWHVHIPEINAHYSCGTGLFISCRVHHILWSQRDHTKWAISSNSSIIVDQNFNCGTVLERLFHIVIELGRRSSWLGGRAIWERLLVNVHSMLDSMLIEHRLCMTGYQDRRLREERGPPSVAQKLAYQKMTYS
jgi:hypothetical protein